MRTLFFDLLLAEALLLLVTSGVQVYHLVFTDASIEALMDKFGAPAAGDQETITAEWDDLIKRAEAQQNKSR